jgi:hypothetical protein
MMPTPAVSIGRGRAHHPGAGERGVRVLLMLAAGLTGLSHLRFARRR